MQQTTDTTTDEPHTLQSQAQAMAAWALAQIADDYPGVALDHHECTEMLVNLWVAFARGGLSAQDFGAAACEKLTAKALEVRRLTETNE